WAALRFQLVGSVLCALLTSVVATVAATDGVGAAGQRRPGEQGADDCQRYHGPAGASIEALRHVRPLLSYRPAAVPDAFVYGDD
ncbi:hypothetical protein AB0F45_32730, partial [Streptomyces achromogenes]